MRWWSLFGLFNGRKGFIFTNYEIFILMKLMNKGRCFKTCKGILLVVKK